MVTRLLSGELRQESRTVRAMQAPLPRTTFHGEAVVVLRDMLVRGELKPGERLAEMQLCTLLGISRTPLREAIRVLAAEGLVTLVPQRGAIVAKPTPEEVQGLLFTLGAIEAFCAPITCNRLTQQQMKGFEKQHKQMLEHRARRRAKEYYEVNQAIHQSIVAGAGNLFMADLYKSLGVRVLRVRYFLDLPDSSWNRSIAEHDQILRLIKGRKGPQLAQLMLVHMEGAWKDFEQAMAHELSKAA